MGVVHQPGHSVRRPSRTPIAFPNGAQLAILDPRLACSRRLAVHSSAFDEMDRLPSRFTADGDGVSPPLRWSGVPSGTVELVLLCEDPDAPTISPFVHWIAYGIAPDVNELHGDVPASVLPESSSHLTQGINSAHRVGFMAAAPPAGHGTHHYHFELFAVDRPLRFGTPPDRNTVVAAMAGHVLASGELIGTYNRA